VALFVAGAACISAQPSFGDEGLAALRAVAGVDTLHAVEPDYREFFPPAQLRRFSRISRMAVAAARRAVENTGRPGVDAVITGTGLGCFSEAEKFLDAVRDRGEELLNPSVFIQSTHHAASSQVAFALDCRGYHDNFCHRAFSFETALLDASLLVAEGAARRVLVGGMDELVPTYTQYLRAAGLLEPLADSPGPVLGEGAGFFVLCEERGGNDLARFLGTGFTYAPGGGGLELELARFFASHLPGGGLPDLVLFGGMPVREGTLERLDGGLLHPAARAGFTQLCGEFHTASAFGFWLAALILHEGHIPAVLPVRGTPPPQLRSVLVLTHHQNREFAWTLLGHV
jgi:3-oxoacyl-[acyl-carrier-protein] synthase II